MKTNGVFFPFVSLTKTTTRPRLGREAWQFHQWRAETDDIRGGTSTASLRGLTDASGQAEFVGVLSDVDNAFAGGEKVTDVFETLPKSCSIVVTNLKK